MTKFLIGDKVRVRSWESMEQEFGLDEDGDMCNRGCCFVQSMRKYCEREFYISGVLDDTFSTLNPSYLLAERNLFADTGDGWNFAEECLEAI